MKKIFGGIKFHTAADTGRTGARSTARFSSSRVSHIPSVIKV